MFCVDVFDPPPFVAVKLTLYVPGVLYVTVGLVKVELDGVPPVKVQLFEVGELVDVFVKATDCPAQIVVGVPVKLATGGGVPATPEMLILSTNRRFPYPERLRNATITLVCPTYGVRLTVSFRHCAAVGVNCDVVAAAVASVVYDLL